MHFKAMLGEQHVASLLMLLPVLVRVLHTCSEEVSQVVVKYGTF